MNANEIRKVINVFTEENKMFMEAMKTVSFRLIKKLRVGFMKEE